MSVRINLEDEEMVVKGPHYYLIKRSSLENLENEVYTLLREKGPMPLSALWRRLNCHLWELTAALRRLERKGLIEEKDTTPEAYWR